MHINISINGRELRCEQGLTVLEVARRAGIEIPSLCHHDLLEPYGGCRLCLVEVEGMRRLQTACTLIPGKGMKVVTESDEVAKARRQTLELLLINHPLDCPFCDKAGECELQRLVIRYGAEEGRYQEAKRNTPAAHQDPILARNMERCVACARCVRVCDEVQGASALSMSGRGDATRVEPFTDSSVDCEYCGNCLSACPVGAILDRLTLHSFRPWQVDRETETVCGDCGVGCSLVVQARDGAVVRVTSRPDLGLNRGLLCARGRFGYDHVARDTRLRTPLVRRDGVLCEASWEESLAFVAERLVDVKARHGGEAIAGIASPRCTNEDGYIFQKLMRMACGSNHVDSISRTGFAAAQRYIEALLGPGAASNPIAEIDGSDAILVVGGDPTRVNPVLGLSVRQAARRGARLGVIGHAGGLEWFASVDVVPPVFAEAQLLEALVADVVEARPSPELPAAIERALPGGSPDRTGLVRPEGFENLKDLVLDGASATIILGMDVVRRRDGHRALAAAAGLTHLLDARLYLLAEGANDQGLVDAGCEPDRLPGGVPIADRDARAGFEEAWNGAIPHFPGLTLMEMVEAAAEGRLEALYVLAANPVFDLPDSRRVAEALRSLELLVVHDMFPSETTAIADVVLPAEAWVEKEGSATNLEGRIQCVRRAVPSPHGRTDWEVLCELAARMGNPMGYSGSGEILGELARLSGLHQELSLSDLGQGGRVLSRAGVPSVQTVLVKGAVSRDRPESADGVLLDVDRLLHHSGTISRNTTALMKLAPEAVAKLGPELASRLGLEDGERVQLSTIQGQVTVPIRIEASLADDRVLLSNQFEGGGAYRLMTCTLDPVTRAPGLEPSEVVVEKVQGVER